MFERSRQTSSQPYPTSCVHPMQQGHPPLELPGRRSPFLPGEERVSIEFPDKGKLRSRRVVSRSNQRCTGKYPGFKAGRMMHYESPHEQNAMRLLDACPGVTSFREQPCIIRYGSPGNMHLHYPDLQVFTVNCGTEFWEIKESCDAAQAAVASRTELLSRLLPLHGYQYRLVTAESIKVGPRLSNAHLLLKLGRKPVTPLRRERIRQLFRQFESLPWAALALDEQGQDLRSQICRLILEGVLTFNFYQPLTDATHIRWVLDQRTQGEESWHSLVSYKVH